MTSIKSDVLFQLKGVSLELPRHRRSIKDFLLLPFGRRRAEWSDKIALLDDINLIIRGGERIGLMGHNGAGKSTLLKVLSGGLPSTSGKFRKYCSPSSLFAVNQGIVPAATGMENIMLRCLESGVPSKALPDIKVKIVEFSGLGSDVDRSVEVYSTGMRLRLAVAINLSLAGDVFLLDEWIGAGDKDFREKIYHRLNEIIEESSCFVIATHNHKIISRVCNRAIVMHEGRIAFDGDVDRAQEVFDDLQALRRASSDELE